MRQEIDKAAAPLLVRPSHASDAARIAAIYRHHVLHGLASFEEEPPDTEELARRRADVLARGLPHLVACDGDTVLGYAYAGPYRTRSAYRYTVEDSVYIAPEAIRRGVGRTLLAADSGRGASIGLHRALGFAPAGMLRAVGFKFGRWVDSVLMQRALGPGDGTSPS